MLRFPSNAHVRVLGLQTRMADYRAVPLTLMTLLRHLSKRRFVVALL